MDKIQRLTTLAREHATGNIFIVGEAIRHAALLRRKENAKYLGAPQFSQMNEAVADMWKSYYAIANMYSLHVELDFKDYYRSLPWWKKRKARKSRLQYMQNRTEQLSNEAFVLIDSILDGEDYPYIYGVKK